MSDHYKEMMDYMYSRPRMYSPHGTIDPNFNYSDYFKIFIDVEEAYGLRKPSLKIYPETLQRCTRSINEA